MIDLTRTSTDTVADGVTSGPVSRAGVEPVARRLLEELSEEKAPPLNELTVPQAREAAAAMERSDAPRPEVEMEERVLPVGRSNGLRLRIVRPPGVPGWLPTIMYFHGGGWVMGDERTHDSIVRALSVGAEAVVVFVDYTRAPEARFPVANEEAYFATAWVAEHGASIGADGTHLAVVGDSAGANMATVVALLAKRRGGPRIAQQVLFYPATDAAMDLPSYREFAHGFFLTHDMMAWSWDHYLPDRAARRQPTASPLRASLDDLRGLPPALVITAEFDVLRDEGEAYARRLAEAGVPVTATRYLGTIHDFVTMARLVGTPAQRSAIAQAVHALRWAIAV
jgi:acetyl esterase